MTRFLKVLFAGFSSTLLVASLVGSYASAQSSTTPALPTTTKAVTQYNDGEEIDRTKNIYGFLRDTLPTGDTSFSFSRDKFNTDFNRAMESGTWGVYQYTWISSGKQQKQYVLFWTYKKHTDCNIQLRLTARSYHLQSFSTENRQDCLFNYVQSATRDNSASNYPRSPIPSITIARDVPPQSNRYELLFFNGEYDLAPGLEGLSLLPRTPTERRQPDFMWTLSADGTFRATYMKNVEELKDNERFCSWRYTVQRKNHDYTQNVGDAFNSDRVNLLAFAHKLEEYGNYEFIIRLDCNFHPPALPKDLSWIKPVTFRFKFDGNLLFGTTFDGNCADGVCKPTPQTCADIKDTLPRISCNMREMFGTGVLNGSLVAAQDLAKAFFVSSSPSCGLTLASTGNRMLDTVNPGKVVAVACERVKTFHQAFPIVIVVVNFLAASLLLWMIVRMFNNLMDHRKDNMIGGLQ